MQRRTSVLTALALAVGLAVTTPASPAVAAGNTLTVDVGTAVRPVTHVGAGGLYSVGSDSRPTTEQLLPLSVNQFTQPPPGTTHLGNGATEPCCSGLDVAANITRAGGQQFLRLPDVFPTFPYQWTSWEDWEGKVRQMVQARLAATTTTNINGYELWNEPDLTWQPDRAGPYLDGWTRTHRLVRSLDPVTPIVGPSFTHYERALMEPFLRHARDTNTLPDVVVWHELYDMGWNGLGDRIAEYRSIERELGISPRPISINEYGSPAQVDIPSAAVHWLSVFERYDVRDAQRAYWYEAGTFDGLFTTSGQPTASYWAYRWYGSMSGNVVRTTPQSWLDGVASYDASRQVVTTVFGGDSGTNTVRLTGLGSFGSQVRVTLDSTPGTGRNTAVAAATRVSSTTYPVVNGVVTVPVQGMSAESAYQLVVTPVNGPTTPFQQVYEAENATVVNAATRTSPSASNGAYVGGIDGSGDARRDSFVDFVVNVPEARSYSLSIRYANGTGATATQSLATNGGPFRTVSYPPTGAWGSFGAAAATQQVTLRAGYNVIRLAKGSPFATGGTGFAELDSITVR